MIAAVLAASAPELAAQTISTINRVRAAQAVMSSYPDSALAMLARALTEAPYLADSVTVYVWTGIGQFLAGRESLTTAAFDRALALEPQTNVRSLSDVAPRLQELFDAARSRAQLELVYTSHSVDSAPRLLASPVVVYPWDVWRRRVNGKASIIAIVDTAGRIEPRSIEIREVPDSGLAEPVRQMLLASTFRPGKLGGRAVRTQIAMGMDLRPGPAPNPTQLVRDAREQIAAGRADSALFLTEFARDSAVRPSEGVVVYALLVRSLAYTALDKNDAARATRDSGLAGYRALSARGVDMAPFLRRLADSLDRAARGAPAAGSRLGALTVVGTPADAAPALVSHPPIVHPPEMRALGVSGTVIVEGVVDTSGRVVPSSLRIVQSPNPGLDAEARRVVLATRYRPGRRGGRPAQVTIRPPILFAGY